MKRDILKGIKEGESIITQRDKLDLYTEDIAELIKASGAEHDVNCFYLARNAYQLGLAVGMRNGKRRARA